MDEMNVYQDFAEFYDLLMQDAPYDEWVRLFNETLRLVQNGELLVQAADPITSSSFGTRARLKVADLGCGTGTITVRLFENGHQVYGVDLSEDMLAQAQAKVPHPTPSLRFLQQDLRTLKLPEPVDAAVSFCDSLNYLLEESDLLQAFRATRSQLRAGGFFLFDMHTPYKLREKLGQNSFHEVQNEVAYIWQSRFDEERCEVEYDVTFFAQEEADLYRRFQEVHLQRAYPREMVERLLREAGFETIVCGADFTWEEPKDTTERYFFLAM